MKIQKEKGIWLIFTGSQRNSRVGSRVPLLGRWPVLYLSRSCRSSPRFFCCWVSMFNLKEPRGPWRMFPGRHPQRTSHTSYASQRHITPRHLMPSQKPGHCGIHLSWPWPPEARQSDYTEGSLWVLPKEDAATLSPGRLSF